MEDDSSVSRVSPEPALYKDFHLFPEDMLSSWVDIPANEPLAMGPISRANLDQLLFSTQDMGRAIHALRAAIVFASRGDTGQAETCLQNCENATNDAITRNRLLYEAIIKSTLEMRDGAK